MGEDLPQSSKVELSEDEQAKLTQIQNGFGNTAKEPELPKIESVPEGEPTSVDPAAANVADQDAPATNATPELTAMANGEVPDMASPGNPDALPVGDYDQFEDGTLDAQEAAQEDASATGQELPAGSDDSLTMEDAAQKKWDSSDPALTQGVDQTLQEPAGEDLALTPGEEANVKEIEDTLGDHLPGDDEPKA